MPVLFLFCRQALVEDSVKFESSLGRIEELLKKQQDEIKKLEVNTFLTCTILRYLQFQII